MNLETERLLTPFHFGAVSDAERLLVERELLIDSEVLTNYLDLKRQLELAAEIPPEPSPALYRRLQAQIKPRRKLILALSFAAGLAAAGIAVATVFFAEPETKTRQTNSSPILYDSGGELSAGTNVL